MPGVFIGSTEITDVGKIKVGNTDVQEIYVGATKIWPPDTGAINDPSDIPGLQFWYDASDASTFTLNGSTVDEWRDKSSFARHMSTTQEFEKPIRTTDGGLDSVFFDSAGNQRLYNDTADISVTSLTVYTVLRVLTTDDIRAWWGMRRDSGAQAYLGTRINGNEARFNISDMGGDPFIVRDYANTFWLRGEINENVSIRVTDNDGVTDIATALNGSFLPLQENVIIGGRSNAGVPAGVTCHVHEIFAHDSILTPEQQTAMENYVNQKWGFL